MTPKTKEYRTTVNELFGWYSEPKKKRKKVTIISPQRGSGMCEEEGCQNAATWCVGTGTRNVHLCDSCCKLVKYDRLRKRVPLNKEPVPPDPRITELLERV